MTNTSVSALSEISAAPDNFLETMGSSATAKRIALSVRPALPALLVGISYYVGTRIGFGWTPLGQPNSTFWPANAILLAAFLLAPRRTWWTLLLAVLPAHMIAQLQAGVPAWTAVGWFVTNTSEALIGALCITRFSDPKNTLASVRGVFTFVVFGVLLAPLATSFLDAAGVVVTGWGRGYWPLGVERFWTNALAELTIVPAIVLCGSNGMSWIRRATIARYSEAAMLAVSIVLVAICVFGFQLLPPSTTPALLYLPLPFLLWAVARFGLGGLSVSLLSVALISIWYTTHGREPFPYASMAENVLSLQILFCVAAVPLMFLSAVMAEAQGTQDSLRRISGSLIEAQEQERHRIARELHDDIGQRLALVAVRLQQTHEDSLVLPEVRNRIAELKKEISGLAEDIQSLSHELHSAKLQYLGLAGAVRGFCQEFGKQQKVEIDFQTHDLPNPISPDIALGLFRIAQEALHNAAKHSGVRQFEVRLWGTSNEIHLTVKDSGVGIDREAAKTGRGIGLISMEERLKLVNGILSIDSHPNLGATIHARVPFS